MINMFLSKELEKVCNDPEFQPSISTVSAETMVKQPHKMIGATLSGIICDISNTSGYYWDDEAGE